MKLPQISTLAGAAAAGLFALVLAAPTAHAQVSFGISIGTPPPPLQYEVAPLAPGPGYVWTRGYWDPYGGRYHWHPGYWQRPPYAGAYWVHPHWDHYPDGWHQDPGFWAHEDHDNHYWDHYHR